MNDARPTYYDSLQGIEATLEEELHGVPTVSLSDAYAKALDDALEDE
jgi:hypothetical protein